VVKSTINPPITCVFLHLCSFIKITDMLTCIRLTCDRNFTDISTNNHDEWSRGRVGCCCHYHACCNASKNITEDDNNETDESCDIYSNIDN
jgi:hypothetical protein